MNQSSGNRDFSKDTNLCKIIFTTQDSVVLSRNGTPIELASFTSTSSNHFSVFNPLRGQIHLFNNSGQFLRDIGRKGHGRGEFVNITGHAILGDSIIVAYDVSQDILKYFDLDGTLISERPQVLLPKFMSRTMTLEDYHGKIAMGVIERRYYPNKVHLSPLIYVVDAQNDSVLATYHELSKTIVTDVEHYYRINGDLLFIAYEDFGVLQKWSLPENIMLQEVHLEGNYITSDQKLSREDYMNARKVSEFRRSRSFVSNLLVNNKSVYLIYANRKDDTNVEYFMTIFDINTLEPIADSKIPHSPIKVNDNDEFQSIFYDSGSGTFMYRRGTLHLD